MVTQRKHTERSVTPLSPAFEGRAPMTQLFAFEGEGYICIDASLDGWHVKLDTHEAGGGFETHYVTLADFDHDTPLDANQARELLAIVRGRELPW